MLIVIVVIAILAAISVIAYSGIQTRAVATALKSDLRGAATQLGIAHAEDGNYPESKSALKFSPGTDLQYTTDGTTYCITAISERKGVPAYHISSSNGDIEEGPCSGHYGPIAELENGAVVSTFAGSGVQGNANGTGVAAQFNGPSSLAIASDGTIYVADSSNDRIERLHPQAL